jgi:hypothetical protein
MTDYPTTEEMIGDLVADFTPDDRGDDADISLPDVALSDRPDEREGMSLTDEEPILTHDADASNLPEPTAKEKELESQLAQVREESAGRLNEMVEMRKAQKEQAENIETMRKMMLADIDGRRAEELKEREIAAYGEDTLEDPAVRAIRDDNARTREMIRRQTEREEHQRQQANQAKAEADAMARQEKQIVEYAEAHYKPFVEEHPDFEDAYAHSKAVRMDLYKKRGLEGEELEKVILIEEFQLTNEAMKKGLDPAEQAWKMALDLGYKPKQRDNLGGKSPYEGVHQTLDKMREGLKTTTLQNSQSTSQTGGRRISREQFFETVPKHERLAILSNQAKSKQLAMTGYVDLD